MNGALAGGRARALSAAALGVATFATVVLAGPVSFLDRPAEGDVAHYERRVARILDGRVPYRDVELEYPPGALVPLLVAAPAGEGYATRFRIATFAVACLAIALLTAVLAAAGAGTARLYGSTVLAGLAPLALTGELFFDRYDVWPAALTLAALAALLTGRRGVGFATLAAAAAAKVFPLVVLPLALLFRRGRRGRGRRDILVFGAAAAVLILPFAVIAFSGLAHTGSVLLRRPLHIESLGGSLLLVADRLGLYDAEPFLSFGGSWDLRGTAATSVAGAQSLLLLGALATVWVLFARGRRESAELLTAAAAAVTAFVAFGKVLSPQFMVWLVFAVPLAARAVWFPAVGLLAGALALTRLYYPGRYAEVIDVGPASWLVLWRNLLLAGLLVLLLVALARRLSDGRDNDPEEPMPRGASRGD